MSDALVGNRLHLLEPSGGGTKATGFVAPALAADVLYTLPTADGAVGEVLTTDGAGTLSWGVGGVSPADIRDAGYWSPWILDGEDNGDSEMIITDDNAPIAVWTPTP